MVEETTFEKLKKALLELLRGYPDYVFYGKIESYLKSGKWGVDLLSRHGIIEKLSIKEVKNHIKRLSPEEIKKLPQGEKRFLWYRLAPRGVDLAVSMRNLEHSEEIIKHSEETLNYSKETQHFTRVLIWFTGILILLTLNMFIIGLSQLILSYLQNPI